MRFFKPCPNLRDNLLFLLFVAQEALYIAYAITGLNILNLISQAIQRLIQQIDRQYEDNTIILQNSQNNFSAI